MSFTVTIAPSGHAVGRSRRIHSRSGIAPGPDIALRLSSWTAPAWACRGKVPSGDVAHGKAQAHALSDTDRSDGFALFCCAQPRSDLLIESREVRKAGDIPLKTLPARVQELVRAAPTS